MRIKFVSVFSAIVLMAFAGIASGQQEKEATSAEIIGHVLRPAQLEATGERIDQLEKPDGVQIAKWAEGLMNPRMIAVADDGTVYVTRPQPGDVLMLRDQNGDGKADERKVVAKAPFAHGIALHEGKMYVATIHEVLMGEMKQDGTVGELEPIVQGLPSGGQHDNRTIAFGPDGKLYISVGSLSNAHDSPADEQSATILRANVDGSNLEIFARGLRNTIGFGWHPESGEMWGMDHGTDWLGDDLPPEELNKIVEGGFYGWPYLWGDNQKMVITAVPPDKSLEELKEKAITPALGYTAHAAPMQMVFYTGDQIAEAKNDAFVAMRGSWNRRPASGYEIVRINFEDGQPENIEPFITGFLIENAADGAPGYFARPTGIAMMNDGSLLLGDDTNGILYRISQDQPEMTPVRDTGDRRAILFEMPLTETQNNIQVSSQAFSEGEAIPQMYSGYADSVSPAISWSNVPENVKSFALVMEDPDVNMDQPFVHWIMYNIPASARDLRQDVPNEKELNEPKGALQGTNSKGTIGYFGPRPPKDDPAHHYHFQIFALDTELDLQSGADRTELMQAMRGHVVGKGQLVGTYQFQE